MAKISQYPDGGAIQSADKIVVARGGVNYSILGSELKGDFALVGQLVSPFNPNDSTNYFFGADFTAGTTVTNRRLYVPKPSVLTGASVFMRATVGSAELSSVYVRLNDTTDYLISAAVNLSASPYHALNASMSVPILTGNFIDFVNIKWSTPNWVTNPTNFLCFFILYFKSS